MRALLFSCLVATCACGPQGPQWEKSETKVTTRLLALHGFAANDVWAVGDDGLALRFDGTQWTKVTSGTSQNLHAVWGATSNDVWVTGEGGIVLRWNGTSLQPVTGVPANRTFDSVRGLDANAVFFCSQLGLYFFDGSFHEFTRGGDAVSCTTLFAHAGGVAALLDQATGSSSEVQTLSASGGTRVTLSGTLTADSSTTMVSTGTSDFWLLRPSASSVLRFGGDMPRELVLPKDMSVNTAFVRSPTDVWLGGSQGKLAHADGMEATLKVAGGYDAPTLHALWGQSGVMFAAGDDGWVLRLVEP
jgi:hypothetical protein